MYQQPDSKHPHLSSKTRLFLEELGKKKAPALYTLSYEAAREVLKSAQSSFKMPKRLDCDIEDGFFPAGPFGQIDVRFYRPKGEKNTLPLLVYYHGGGWVMGNKLTHERLMRELCVGAHIAILFVNYRPSPESQYPNLLEENYAALEYVAQHAQTYNINAEQIIVGGDSVGGNISAVMCLFSKQRKGSALLKQILLYPVTDGKMDSPSYGQFADGPWLTQKAMAYFWDAYLPDVQKRTEVDASPLYASLDMLKGLPGALIITDENDVLRDEGEAYADLLMQAGVDVAAVRYKGTIHDFMMLNGLAETRPAQEALQQTILFLKQSFYG